MRRGVLLVALIASARVAGADPWREEILLDKLDLYTGEFGKRLRLLSLEVIDLRLDVRHEKAKVRIGGGTECTALHLDSDIRYLDDGWARVDASFDVVAFRKHMQLRLPT